MRNTSEKDLGFREQLNGIPFVESPQYLHAQHLRIHLSRTSQGSTKGLCLDTDGQTTLS